MHNVLLFVIGVCAAAAGPIGGVISLVSFPALLAIGYNPLVANVTNTVAIVTPATISSSLAYRKHITIDRRTGTMLFCAGAIGGLTGALLLVSLGKRIFDVAVPALLIVGAILILAQPLVSRRLSNLKLHAGHTKAAVIGTSIVSIYAGYFGAGAGVLIFALFATLLSGNTQQANALKSFVSIASNLAATSYFLLGDEIAWAAVIPLTLGSFAGGPIGVRIAQRLPDAALRIIVCLGGLSAALFALRG